MTLAGVVAAIMFLGIIPRILGGKRSRRLVYRRISQTALAYRDSALSGGKAGRIQGGDRLPWVDEPDGADNFGPLRSLAWQVHVYGEPRPGVREACARAGLERDAFYLIRPDGYVGLAAPGHDLRALTDFLAKYRIIEDADPATLPSRSA